MSLDLSHLIWATRGHSWGFRFLSDGGVDDPLPVYDAAFRGHRDERELCARVDDRVALRFVDPEGRQDFAGRPIPHEVVVMGELADQIGVIGPDAVEGAVAVVWPVLRDRYAEVWRADAP